MEDSGRRRRISLELPEDLLKQVDELKAEWGLRSRGDLFARLLRTVLPGACPDVNEEPEHTDSAETDDFDEQCALVLVDGPEQRDGFGEHQSSVGAGLTTTRSAQRSKPGIDLPGFVRRQSVQLKQSLQPRGPRPDSEVLPLVSGGELQRCLEVALSHWLELYGGAPHEAVLEAAMIWLAQDIWSQCDQNEGRPFTWSLAVSVVKEFAPSLSDGPPSFERVMVVAGLLEDPFSSATLDVRMPSLIRRFVHRFRRRRRGTSFQTLEHTMTLHGALKLLQLPTAPGHRLSLREIKDAYRQVAIEAHPDSGGSTEAMRRVNEAYQLLKELYRPGDRRS
ncbi:MAG: DnaJ domain-containing protein [Cyanobacteriota bacterium]|nr:DnaJ domain-containing protein [Cyanobacteriota bacterium]